MRRPYNHANSSSTVGSSSPPDAMSKSPAESRASGMRQYSSRNLGESRLAQILVAPARSSAGVIAAAGERAGGATAASLGAASTGIAAALEAMCSRAVLLLVGDVRAQNTVD